MSSRLKLAPNRITNLELPHRQPVSGLSLRAAERELERESSLHAGLLDLTYADTKRFAAPPWAIRAFTEAATSGGMSYTSYRGDRDVRDTVAANVSAFMGLSIDPDREIILTPGTQAALYIAISSIVEVNDKVVIADPDYLTNERLMKYFGSEVIKLPLRWEDGEKSCFDFDELEAAFRKQPKVFVFSNPNNPSGMIHDGRTLRRIAELANKYDVLVIADELYSRLVYNGLEYTHLATLEGMKDRTITLMGPSKTESMSGYRLGVAIAPRAIIDRMEDVQSVASLRAPAYAQRTLVHWLKDDMDLVATRVKEYQSLRDMVVRTFNNTNFIRAVPSQGTSYIFPRLIGIDASDQEVALHLQRKAGVIINPGYQSGERGTGHVRICFAQDKKIMSSALDRIVGALATLRS